MECHKCEHRAAVEVGRCRGRAFEDTPCARCDGTSPEPYTLPYCEEKRSSDPLSEELSVPEQAFPVADPPEESYSIEALVPVFAEILALPDFELRMLRLRRRGSSYESIASALGSTPRGVQARFVRLMARFPVLATLFPSYRGNVPGK